MINVYHFIKGVSTGHSGNYSCSAANFLGEAASQSITLDVKCRFYFNKTKRLIGAVL